MATLYTTAEAAEVATRWRRTVSAGAAAVTPAAIRQWASRQHLDIAGLDDHGHPLYELRALARAELATRRRALRHVSTSQNSDKGANDQAALAP